MTSGWEILSAVATAGAVVVAVGIAVGPAVASWINRPRLKLVVGQQEPHLLAIVAGEFPPRFVIMRVEVKNSGRTAATGCWASLGTCRQKERLLELPDWPEDVPSPSPPELEIVEDEPTRLHWSSLPTAADRGPIPGTVTIPRGASEHVELVRYDRKTNKVAVMMDDERAGRGSFQLLSPIATHWWDITVGADGIEPVKRTVRFTVDHSTWITDTAIVEPPTDARDGRLMATLRSLPPSSDEA